jgi:hypothetical protein
MTYFESDHLSSKDREQGERGSGVVACVCAPPPPVVSPNTFRGLCTLPPVTTVHPQPQTTNNEFATISITMSSSSLRSRNTTSATAREQPMNNQENQNNPSLVNPTSAKWLILIILFLTTTIGTYRSFSIYSRDNPDIPIHQLTRIPLSSLLSTHTTDIRSTTTTLPYFANKSNFLNQKFVKLGWAWTTFVVWFHAIAIATCYFGPSHPNQQQQKQNTRSHPSSHVPRILSLHLVATLLWIFLTQWCFGSSLIERVLILSGAKCIPSLKPFHSSETTPATPTTLENLYCQHRWGRKLPGLDKV